MSSRLAVDIFLEDRAHDSVVDDLRSALRTLGPAGTEGGAGTSAGPAANRGETG
jgi:hypothetical protein